jgi:hypothetical protein
MVDILTDSFRPDDTEEKVLCNEAHKMLLVKHYPTNLTLTTLSRNSGAERIEQLIQHRQLSIIVNATYNMLQEGFLTTTTSKAMNTPSLPSTFSPPYLCNEQLQ